MFDMGKRAQQSTSSRGRSCHGNRENLHETLVGHFLDPMVIDRMSNVVESGRVQGGAPSWAFDGVHYHYNQREDLHHNEFLRSRIHALGDRIEKYKSQMASEV